MNTVVNASKIVLTGGKETKKVAYRHSGHPGGLTETRYDRLLDERPAFVVQKAVKGMLPKNRLGRSMLRKLQVYEGAEHPHAAQQPKALAVGEVPRWDGLPAPAAEDARPKAKSPARKPATAKRAGAKRAAKKPAAKATTKKTTAKKSAKKTTKKVTAKKPAATKSAAKSSTAGASKSRLRRTKKEGEDA